VIAEKGYDRASIRDISRATGVSLSGLYYYVESKEELLFLIQDHCFGTVIANLERLLEGVEDPERRLRLLVDNHLRYFVNNIAEMKVLAHEAESLRGEYLEAVNGKKRRYAERCAEILTALRPADGVDVRVATFALFGMMNWVYTWYRPGRDVGVAELAETMSQLFLRGFLSGSEAPGSPERKGLDTGEARPSIWRR
jgi:TetR/AcrR family transcriptional regulator, cholesterol catabolism regulator